MINVTKDSGWLAKLNANDVSNTTSDTGWKQDGIVYLNGFTNAAGADGLRYRIQTFGDSKLGMIYIAGYQPAGDQYPVFARAGSQICTLPKEVLDRINGTIATSTGLQFGRTFLSIWGEPLEISLDGSTAQFTIVARMNDIKHAAFIDAGILIKYK